MIAKDKKSNLFRDLFAQPVQSNTATPVVKKGLMASGESNPLKMLSSYQSTPQQQSSGIFTLQQTQNQQQPGQQQNSFTFDPQSSRSHNPGFSALFAPNYGQQSQTSQQAPAPVTSQHQSQPPQQPNVPFTSHNMFSNYNQPPVESQGQSFFTIHSNRAQPGSSYNSQHNMNTESHLQPAVSYTGGHFGNT